jgi:hypothetical protein
MKNTDTNKQPDPIDELWETIGDLLAEHGEQCLLQTIACYAECESEDEDVCDGCQKRAAAVHRIVEQAIQDINNTGSHDHGESDPWMDSKLSQ